MEHKAVIKKIKNQVEYKYEDNLWDTAKINQVIVPVTSIRTGAASKAEIMYSDGTVTRIGSDTFFTFLDKQNRAVQVQLGSAWFDVKKKSYGLKIYTANAIAVITGTEGFIQFSGNSQNNGIYIVKDGDTLNGIARKIIGVKSTPTDIKNFIENVLKLNPDVIKNRNLVYKGQKLIIENISNKNASENKFAIGLIEGTSDVFKTNDKGEATGNTQKVKEGEVLILKGDKFSVESLDSFLKIPKGMTIVKGGTFQMGNSNGESDEKPVHDVSVNSFYISKYEVTQSEYQDITGNNPSNFKGNNLPVENVSWWDAIKYCNKKSLAENLPVSYNESTGELLDSDGKPTKDVTQVVGYRLPTEAEWEYAARGGYKTNNYLYSGSNDVDNVAWYGYTKSEQQTHPIGTKSSNEIGVFDMSGNVSEWVSDAYVSDAYNKPDNNLNPYFSPETKDAFRVYRGGSWDYIEMYQTVFSRSGYLPDYKGRNIGFRIVKNISF